MARYLINNKIYDTEKSTEILKYIKSVVHNGMIKTYPQYQHTLYKSPKGQFFSHIGKFVGYSSAIKYDDEDYIELLTEDEVKEILTKLNKIDKFIELFGKVEEG